MSEPVTYTESAKVDEIKKFFNQFKDKSGNYKYVDKIDSMTGPNVLIDLHDLFDYELESKTEFKIWTCFTEKPAEAIRLCKRAVTEVYSIRHGFEKAMVLDPEILLDKSDLEITVGDAIRNKNLNKLVSLNCRINGETELRQRIVKGVWVCNDGHPTEGISEPIMCSEKTCKQRELKLNQENSKYESYRVLYVKDLEFDYHHQDALVVHVTGEMTKSVKMGETVKFTGYVTIEEFNKKLINVFHAFNASKPDEINLEVTLDDIEYFEKLVKIPDHYERLIDSIAPNIYGSRLLKEGFLLAYTGSSQWDSQQRNWINILAVGDPATAKSKIAQWGTENLENVNFISSKAGSAKGLFAGQKEQADGEKVLEIGPMVSLSNRGLLCIDEFPRMRETHDIFYSPMETGTFHSATVGGHTELEAKTPIYATGNPSKSNFWDDGISVIENLQMFEPSMLSRFDLIIICKDENTSEDNKNIAFSILGQSNSLNDDSEPKKIHSTEMLTKFLRYAKTFNPVLTKDVIDTISETFVDIMNKKKSSNKHEETNGRFVGTLARITLAIARLHLHRETTMEDFQKAHDLIKIMMAQRGLQASNANTYIERVGQMIIKILEESKSSLTDPEIYNALFERFSDKHDSLSNDIGEGGPLRTQNKRWRAIMDHIEKSFMIEVESKKPRKLRYKHTQITI